MKLVSTEDALKKFDDDFNNCAIRYGDMKKQLAEDMVKFISPIREKAKSILANEKYLREGNGKGCGKSKGKCQCHHETCKRGHEIQLFLGLNM
jgi:tryptophanyl-tRNA synthetase